MAPCAIVSEKPSKDEFDGVLSEKIRGLQVRSGTAATTASPSLSSRGQRHGAKVTPFWDTFDRIIGNAFCHAHNPTGIVNMAISNNYLLEPELLAFFKSNLQMHPTDLTYGTSLFGSHRLFATLCQHFNSPTFRPVRRVEPKHLITGPGCGPLLDQLSEHLFERGDGVLLAAPYYNGYDADLACRGEVTCVPVFSTSCDGSAPSNFEGPSALREFATTKAGWERSNPDNKIRAVIVCNPHNPVGRCYDRQALIEYGRFAQQHNVHLIFDEIFALSTYGADGASEPFHSALSIDWEKEAGCDGARVHIVWSASKDFGVNGLRIGTLISQSNPGLLRAMKATAKLYMVSSPADALFCSLIDRQDVYHDFIETNKARMAQAYSITTQWATHHRIPFCASNAGHFILVDLTRFLPSKVDGTPLHDDAAREGALWAKLLEHNVCLTPGSNYHHPQLGMFRLTFTLRRQALLEGLSRLESALGLEAWPMRPQMEYEQLAEPVMKTIPLAQPSALAAAATDASTQTIASLYMRGSARPRSPSPRPPTAVETDKADAERLDYVDAVRQVLKQGGGQEALLSCGMGMSCSACC